MGARVLKLLYWYWFNLQVDQMVREAEKCCRKQEPEKGCQYEEPGKYDILTFQDCSLKSLGD
jgi:hypothetical protein